MVAPVVRFRIDFSPQCGLAPANMDLLEAIRTTGSLSRGARGLGMSYRRARLLLDGFKGAFREPVTRAVRGGPGGGGILLTPFGESLLDHYRALEREFDSLASERLSVFTAAASSARTSLTRGAERYAARRI
jgi:molybdate transport system regulatory protein